MNESIVISLYPNSRRFRDYVQPCDRVGRGIRLALCISFDSENDRMDFVPFGGYLTFFSSASSCVVTISSTCEFQNPVSVFRAI